MATTEKTLPFVKAFKEKYGNHPSNIGYTTYDAVYYITDAIERAGGTDDSEMLVDAMEKTDYVGTIGRIQFNGKGSANVHGLKVGKGYITGLMLQWQDGKEINFWPPELANGDLKFPDFIKVKATQD